MIASILSMTAAATGLMYASPMIPVDDRIDDLQGLWRVVLESPGGELPFSIEIGEPGASPPAVILNGDERAPFSHVTIDDETVVLAMDWYDSRIVATLNETNDRMTGTWTKRSAEGASQLPFHAVRGESHRFGPRKIHSSDAAAAENIPPTVDGVWRVQFADESGTDEARGEFHQEGARVTGTFLTPLGDYRFLEGDYANGFLRLSCFDGGHAFLFTAEAQPDGNLRGDFWSRDSYHATWTAAPIGEDNPDQMPDPWSIVKVANSQSKLRFSFPDLNGNPVSLADDRFTDKVVLVNLFGSWCPNCNDEAPVLAEWYRRYRGRGFEIIGLAYEFTGDPERDRGVLGKFASRYGIEYPLLLAGISDKSEAAKTLPDITDVVAYPTTIFVGREGRVRRIYTGFAGPGAAGHHERLIAEFEAIIEAMLDEPRPDKSRRGSRAPAGSSREDQ